MDEKRTNTANSGNACPAATDAFITKCVILLAWNKAFRRLA